MGIMGYRRRTSFLCGIATAQVSEFSLILAALGLKLGHLGEKAVSLITAVGIITIIISSYLIIYGEDIFRRISKFLSIFERRNKKEEFDGDPEFSKPVVLIGGHRVGWNIVGHLPKDELLVIDFDPDVVARLKKNGYNALFGDIYDTEIIERANLGSARLIISTVPELKDNLSLLEEINKSGWQGSRPKVILRAEEEGDARALYAKGADYVLFPCLTSGQYLGKSIAIDKNLNILEQLKKKDLENLSS